MNTYKYKSRSAQQNIINIVLDMNVRISSAIEGYDWYVILDER